MQFTLNSFSVLEVSELPRILSIIPCFLELFRHAGLYFSSFMFLLIRLKRHSRMNDFYHRNPAEPSLQLMLQMLHSSNILQHLWDGRQLSLPSELLQAADDANHNQSNYVIRFLDLRSPIFVPNKQSLVTNNRYFLCVFSDKISFSCDKS